MERTISVETEDIGSSTETESLIENTPRKMSEYEIEASPSVSVTFAEAFRQIRAVTDPLSPQLARLFKLMRERKNEQANNFHEETASSRTASSSAGSGGRFDNM